MANRLTILLALSGLAAATPAPIPPPPDDDCTMTLTRYTGAFRPAFPTPSRKAYTTTETETSFINCGICSNLEIFETRAPWFGGPGPAVKTIATVTVREPTTVTEFECKKTPHPRLAIPRQEGGIDDDTDDDDDDDDDDEEDPIATEQPVETAVEEGCTSTLVQAEHFNLDPTETVWPGVETVTKLLDCGGCSELETMVLNMGVGPAVFRTKTVTAETPSTTLEYACRPTEDTETTPLPEYGAYE